MLGSGIEKEFVVGASTGPWQALAGKGELSWKFFLHLLSSYCVSSANRCSLKLAAEYIGLFKRGKNSREQNTGELIYYAWKPAWDDECEVSQIFREMTGWWEKKNPSSRILTSLLSVETKNSNMINVCLWLFSFPSYKLLGISIETPIYSKIKQTKKIS